VPMTIESAPLINLRWIVRLRWLAVMGQVATILVGSRLVATRLPVATMLIVCGALAAANLVVQLWLFRGAKPRDRASGVNLIADVVALTALLALSGGASNPFSLLYLVHITIAAVILPARWVLAVAGAGALAYSALAFAPLAPLDLNPSHIAILEKRGPFIAFLVAAAFISTFSFRMSRALRLREEELHRARANAEGAERMVALGTLAAGTAHELNTPLGTIAILAGELVDQLEGDRRTEAAEIRAQVRRCKEIITSMLAPRAGEFEEPEEFALDDAVARARTRWQKGRPGPHPELQISPEAIGATVRLPKLAFERAIENLLENAAEATEGRSTRMVRILLSREGEDLSLTVADNGVGVPEALRNRVGEPFFTTKGPGRGSGLGLYLARNVVERQGGEMSVISKEGEGTRVVLLVPAA
jgi:two-component system sensor histidine kinase RegB